MILFCDKTWTKQKETKKKKKTESARLLDEVDNWAGVIFCGTKAANRFYSSEKERRKQQSGRTL